MSAGDALNCVIDTESLLCIIFIYNITKNTIIKKKNIIKPDITHSSGDGREEPPHQSEIKQSSFCTVWKKKTNILLTL